MTALGVAVYFDLELVSNTVPFGRLVETLFANNQDCFQFSIPIENVKAKPLSDDGLGRHYSDCSASRALFADTVPVHVPCTVRFGAARPARCSVAIDASRGLSRTDTANRPRLSCRCRSCRPTSCTRVTIERETRALAIAKRASLFHERNHDRPDRGQ